MSKEHDPSPEEMGIQSNEGGKEKGHRAENEAWVPEEFHEGEEAIQECLTTKRMGFKEIAVQTTEDVISRAPKNETFTVPDERYQTTYETRARSLGRKDVKFVVGE